MSVVDQYLQALLSESIRSTCRSWTHAYPTGDDHPNQSPVAWSRSEMNKEIGTELSHGHRLQEERRTIALRITFGSRRKLEPLIWVKNRCARNQMIARITNPCPACASTANRTSGFQQSAQAVLRCPTHGVGAPSYTKTPVSESKPKSCFRGVSGLGVFRRIDHG